MNAYNVLEEQQSDSTDDDNDTALTLPLFTALRARGDENQHKYGASLGAIGTGFGIGGFYSYNFTEDLNVSFSGGFLDILGNTGVIAPPLSMKMMMRTLPSYKLVWAGDSDEARQR